MEVELDDGGKYDRATDWENKKHNKKSNLVELNKIRKQPKRCHGVCFKKFVFSKVALSFSQKF